MQGDDFGETFLPHVVLNVFRPYFLDLVRHYVEQRQLARIVCLLAPSGHAFPSLYQKTGRRREGGLPVIVFRLGEFQLFGVINDHSPVMFIEDNLVPFLDAELLPDFAGSVSWQREVSLASSMPVLLVSYFQVYS